MISIKIKVLLEALKKNDYFLLKLIAGLVFGIMFFLIIIVAGIVTALNPFNSNRNLDGQGGPDTYLEATKIMSEETGIDVRLNLDYIKSIECHVVVTDCDLTSVSTDEIIYRIKKYYVSKETETVKEEVPIDGGNKLPGEEVGETKTVSKSIEKYRSLKVEEIYEKMAVDYPEILDPRTQQSILGSIDLQKNIGRVVVAGLTFPIAEEEFIYYEPFGTYIENDTPHYGVDLSASAFTEVVAFKEGTIIKVHDGEPNQTPGVYNDAAVDNYIWIEHDIDGRKIVSVYAHLQPGITVKKDDVVQAGEPIGSVGNSGRSTGYHLHFELRDSCLTSSCAVDPLIYLNLGELRAPKK